MQNHTMIIIFIPTLSILGTKKCFDWLIHEHPVKCQMPTFHQSLFKWLIYDDIVTIKSITGNKTLHLIKYLISKSCLDLIFKTRTRRYVASELNNRKYAILLT